MLVQGKHYHCLRLLNYSITILYNCGYDSLATFNCSPTQSTNYYNHQHLEPPAATDQSCVSETINCMDTTSPLCVSLFLLESAESRENWVMLNPSVLYNTTLLLQYSKDITQHPKHPKYTHDMLHVSVINRVNLVVKVSCLTILYPTHVDYYIQ